MGTQFTRLIPAKNLINLIPLFSSLNERKRWPFQPLMWFYYFKQSFATMNSHYKGNWKLENSTQLRDEPLNHMKDGQK